MKKIEILKEITSHIDFFHINENWISHFENYLNIISDKDEVDNQFVFNLKLTNDFLMELSNSMPIFLEGGNFEQFLMHSEKALQEFNFKHFPFLLNFYELIKIEFVNLIDNTTYGIELNELSEILDGVLFFIYSEMNDY